MTDDDLLAVLGRAADAARSALGGVDDWGPSGRPGQHHSDLAADAAVLAVLDRAGLGVFSEESGWTGRDRPVVVVVDPLDGSTNAARGISWWAVSLCALDARGPRAAVVDDLVHGTRFRAVRGGGAHRVTAAVGDGTPGGPPTALRPSACTEPSRALVGLNGLPARHLGWAQCRALGAAALDLAAVAAGHLDAFVDCTAEGLAPWDYLGGLLLCREAGATVLGLDHRPLHDLEPPVRRPVVAAATPELAAHLVDRIRASGPLPGSTAS